MFTAVYYVVQRLSIWWLGVPMLRWLVLGGARVRLRQLMAHFEPYLHRSHLPWQSHKIVKPLPHLALLNREGGQAGSL